MNPLDVGLGCSVFKTDRRHVIACEDTDHRLIRFVSISMIRVQCINQCWRCFLLTTFTIGLPSSLADNLICLLPVRRLLVRCQVSEQLHARQR